MATAMGTAMVIMMTMASDAQGRYDFLFFAL